MSTRRENLSPFDEYVMTEEFIPIENIKQKIKGHQFYLKNRPDTEDTLIDYNNTQLMLIPRLKKEFFSTELFAKKRQETIDFFLKRRGIDPTDTAAVDAAKAKDNQELNQLLSKISRGAKIIIPNNLYELNPTDEMVLDYIYRNWKVNTRQRDFLDGKEYEYDFPVNMFDPNDLSIVNGMFKISLTGWNNTASSLMINSRGRDNTWTRYLTNIYAKLDGTSSVVNQGIISILFQTDPLAKINGINLRTGLPKDKNYSIDIPLGNVDGCTKGVTIDLYNYLNRALPNGSEEQAKCLADKLIYPGDLWFSVEALDQIGGMPLAPRNGFTSDEQMYNYVSAINVTLSSIQEYWGNLYAPEAKNIRSIVENQFYKLGLKYWIEGADADSGSGTIDPNNTNLSSSVLRIKNEQGDYVSYSKAQYTTVMKSQSNNNVVEDILNYFI